MINVVWNKNEFAQINIKYEYVYVQVWPEVSISNLSLRFGKK